MQTNPAVKQWNR